MVAFNIHQIVNGTVKITFPKSMSMLRKIVGIDRDDFDKYVVCPSCKHLYRSNDVVEGGVNICTKNVFKRGNKKVPCGTQLRKYVHLRGNKDFFYPTHIYCYRSITNLIEELLGQDDMEEKCEAWRKREIPPGCYADIYDGEMWKSNAI